ncbi:MAG TPA: cupin domain-containing protein [Gammaproteobacteria bacterium]|nr:cupin domain-containing protein [Gammaproteobacteria bacterium]
MSAPPTPAEPVNGDLRVRVAVDTAGMPWTPSPSGTVWRKRVHLVGPVEAGQVTSVVRYEPGATFRAHAHPDGEEILVLEGVFSDEHGDWPAGTYLLNPEGFRHAPFSREGCVLFVKLRQFPGRDRVHAVLNTHVLDWQRGDRPGVDVCPLYSQPGFADTMRLERWAPGATPGERRYPGGAEMFVLRGAFTDEGGVLGERSWLRLPPGAVHTPFTAGGCELYIKEGGFAYLAAG